MPRAGCSAPGSDAERQAEGDRDDDGREHHDSIDMLGSHRPRTPSEQEAEGRRAGPAGSRRTAARARRAEPITPGPAKGRDQVVEKVDQPRDAARTGSRTVRFWASQSRTPLSVRKNG